MADVHPPADASRAIVEMHDVKVGMPERPGGPSIEDVHWTIAPGDFWIVSGLEETGKTEFLLTAFGLQPPLAGTVKIFGRTVSTLTQDEILQQRLRLGFIFEAGARLLRRLTVYENIALPLQYHEQVGSRGIAAEVDRVAAALDITSCLDKMPGRIPRSAQQRVGLARALISKPEVLFLDKPVVGLDPKETRWWIDLLQELHRGHPFLDGRPVTLVLSTNDLRSWRQSGRQFGFIRNRRWTVIGGREELEKNDEPLLRELLWPDFLTE